MVGPEIRKNDAEATRQKLADDERFKLKGLVRIYVP
jgi:DedD protein